MSAASPAVCLLLLLSVSVRQALSWTFHLPKIGGCPDMDAQKGLLSNIEQFLNTWYVQSSFDTEILQGKGRCMTASYKYNPINQAIIVSTGQFNEDSEKWERLDADAVPLNKTDDEGKFTVEFTIPIWGTVSGKYTVLNTDFTSYSVIHGCGSFFGILHYDCSWLMSRKQVLSSEEEHIFYKHINQTLERYDNLDPKEFKRVDQVHCDRSSTGKE